MDKATEPKPVGKGAKRRRRGKVTPRVAAETQVLRVAAPPGSQSKMLWGRRRGDGTIVAAT
jgi:hypothetical protein